MDLQPHYTEPAGLARQMRDQGWAALSPQGVCELTGCDLPGLMALRPTWEGLPPDNHLRDGGRYRWRRHACFVVEGERLRQAPHRAHWQPLEYNALHGGMLRHFEPMLPGVVQGALWQRLLCGLGLACSALSQGAARPPAGSPPAWFVEAHQFRIDTTGGIGRPTPEGAHRDGVDYVAVFLVDRHGIKGGETRVFQANSPLGQRFTLTDPWCLLLLDDQRVIHESTPIQPLAAHGWRDTLVLTFRAGGFLGD